MNDIINQLQEELLSRLSRSDCDDRGILILKSYVDARLELIQYEIEKLKKSLETS